MYSLDSYTLGLCVVAVSPFPSWTSLRVPQPPCTLPVVARLSCASHARFDTLPHPHAHILHIHTYLHLLILLFSSAMLPEQEGVDSVPTFPPTSRLLCIYRYHLQTKDRSDSSFMYHQAM
ncbi:uncharacterized protein SCHCODRAFT_02641013 [Schizophyllum commune H4-8]|uniref:uncharacterized protein n=1 Tax=Schizophyllum commune (strain H4-8 / FGSC 9210) TaxID=578458 RepID=UPI00215F3BB1|nr:uncharacterized protein SCHCODRAFT_02641013 [Schizophyllum commune H4-8]KAI5887219.1 hypothetical protein SCHCODRAFT_02641013 [Schizophyllum commune H4-8]